MRTFVWAGIIAAFSTTIMVAGCQIKGHPTYDTLIQNVSVIDAETGLRSHQDVLIRDGIIVDVRNHRGELQREKGKAAPDVIDGSEKFLIPGLWDAHVHLTFEPSMPPETFLQLSLVNGLTSLRDTGGQIDQVTDIRARAQQQTGWPTIYIAGPLLDGDHPVYDGHSPNTPKIAVPAPKPENVDEFVADLAQEGVDFIKTYEMLRPQTLEAIVNAAKRNGLKVVGHPPLSMTVSEAVEYGITDIQHFRNLEMACAHNEQDLLNTRLNRLANPGNISSYALRSAIRHDQTKEALENFDEQRCESLVKRLAELQVFETPTYIILTLLDRESFASPKWLARFAYLPKVTSDQWRAKIDAYVKSRPPALVESPSQATAWTKTVTSLMLRHKTPMMAGTDAPIGFQTPGFTLHDELYAMVEFGFTPLQAIEAATLTPARFFDKSDHLGLIRPNMTADLVLLNANPLEEIQNTEQIELVIKEGHIHSREDLDTILDQLSARP